MPHTLGDPTSELNKTGPHAQQHPLQASNGLDTRGCTNHPMDRTTIRAPVTTVLSLDLDW